MRSLLSLLCLAALASCGRDPLGPAEFHTEADALRRYGTPCQVDELQKIPPAERFTYHVVFDASGDLQSVPCPDSYENIWHITLVAGFVVKDWADITPL